jgi:hypothetical protein
VAWAEKESQTEMNRVNRTMIPKFERGCTHILLKKDGVRTQIVRMDGFFVKPNDCIR